MSTPSNNSDEIKTVEVDGIKYKLMPLDEIVLPPPDEDDEGYSGPTDAPWSPVPTQLARDYLAEHPEAAIDIIFPSAWEEDQKTKIANIASAEAASYITHERAAEMVVTELGVVSYDYEEEQQKIQGDRATLPPDNDAPDPVVQASLAPLAGDQRPKRDALSGDAVNAFKKQQKEVTVRTLLRDPKTGLVTGLIEEQGVEKADVRLLEAANVQQSLNVLRESVAQLAKTVIALGDAFNSHLVPVEDVHVGGAAETSHRSAE